MRLPFVVRLAWQEGRGSARRVWLHALAVSLGVAALVSVHGFRADAERSIDGEARTLLGADARLSGRDEFPDSVQAVVDSLASAGSRVATVVQVPSMVLATRTETARLVQVRGVEGAWPFYGPGTSRPAAWPPADTSWGAFVDPAALVQLGIDVGDTLLIGDQRVAVVATVHDFPAELGFQTAVGPRVFVPRALVERAGLLGFGSLARYETFIATTDEDGPEQIWDRHRSLLRASGTAYTTAAWRAEDLTEGLRALSRFLGIVGLVALILGGIGVASAVHVFVRAKLPSVAVLRCLGMTRGALLRSNLVQAGALGLMGSLAGAMMGLALQLALPVVLADFLPVPISSRVSPVAVSLGVVVGLVTTVVFALGPLLAVRRVSPLLALRRDFEESPPATDRLVVATYAAAGALIVLLAVLEAPSAVQGLWLAAGLAIVLGALWGLAALTTWGVRRFFPTGASYALRQGIANLYRPRNQTVPVVLALGFGVFVVGALGEVERNLTEGLSLDAGDDGANVLLFDIQTDQRIAVEALVRRYSAGEPVSTPMIPSRIAAVDGRPAAEILADSAEGGPSRWALRREYRSSYRRELTSAEEVVAGEWWEEEGVGGGAPVGISMEVDVAESLGLEVGSRVAWTLGGRRLETEIRSLRSVDWARFEPNFYVLFEPGSVDDAPQTWVTLAHVEDEHGRARLQRDVAVGFTNVSVLDLARVQDTLDSLLGTARRVVRFLSWFAALAGVVILAGAVAVTRSQRMREAALLKTLGAPRKLVLRILIVEYATLGGLAVVGALTLATLAAWALTTQLFEMPFRPHALPALTLASAVTALALAGGLVGSLGILGRPPLRVLRELSE